MPWSGDQLPWGAPISKPVRPSGVWEPLNWMKGPPTLLSGGIGGNPSGPPIMLGTDSGSNLYAAPVMLKGGVGRLPNLYAAPAILSSNPVRLYGAPAILAGVRIRGKK